MLVSEVIEQIKALSRQHTSEEWDSVILRQINLSLRDYTAKNLYQELLVIDAVATLQIGQGYVELPEPIQHFVKKSVRYNSGGRYSHPLFDYNKFRRAIMNGTSARYRLLQSRIYIYPFDSILAGDTISFSYYKVPDILVPEDEFPVPALTTTVINAVCAVIASIAEPKDYMKFKSEERTSFNSAISESQNG